MSDEKFVKYRFKGDIRHFFAASVKQVAKTTMIRFHAALVGQKYIAHEDDGGVGNQGIKIPTLNFL